MTSEQIQALKEQAECVCGVLENIAGYEHGDIEVSVFDGERVFTAHYAVGSLPQPWGDWVDTYANITHWQPLPDAPKGV